MLIKQNVISIRLEKYVVRERVPEVGDILGKVEQVFDDVMNDYLSRGLSPVRPDSIFVHSSSEVTPVLKPKNRSPVIDSRIIEHEERELPKTDEDVRRTLYMPRYTNSKCKRK